VARARAQVFAGATEYIFVSLDSVMARIAEINTAFVPPAQTPTTSTSTPSTSNFASALQSATAGNPGVGPWCAYFVSWAARQAGAPLGNMGQGFGSVDQLWSWAQSSGRAYQGTQQQPQPGDLIVFHEHVGMVESVLPDGRIQTIEGNSSDQVSRRIHAPGDAMGYVRVG